MRSFVRIFFSVLFSLAAGAQEFTLVVTLDESIDETSGLLYLDQRIITHNDAGGAANLYELNPVDGTVLKTTTVSNATNIDWEDITSDDQYIYIGDFGNVSGDRTDLKIYRIAISDYINASNNTVVADIINYSYEDQTDFTPGLFATNYDAEALISYGDSLYVFTKNWVDQKTNIYSIPKMPGTYSAVGVDSIDSQGLVTAATYNNTFDHILLAGYTLTSPFIIELHNFTNAIFSSGSIDRYDLQTPSGYSTQIEAITFRNENEYYLTAEKGMLNQNPGLYSFTSSILGSDTFKNTKSIIYPNPARDEIEIISKKFDLVEVYDLKGTLLGSSFSKKMNVSNFKKGIYLLKIYYRKNDSFTFYKLIHNKRKKECSRKTSNR